MFERDGRYLLERTRRVVRDEQSLARIRKCLNGRLRYRTLLAGQVPGEFHIWIDVRSVTAIDTSGTPLYHDAFEFRVLLPRGYPVQMPKVMTLSGSAIPFHPQFTIRRHLIGMNIGRQYAVWCDHKAYEQSNTLGCFVLRIVEALRFSTDSVTTEVARVGNGVAARWYEHALSTMHAHFFPTDTRDTVMAMAEECRDMTEREATLDAHVKSTPLRARGRTFRVDARTDPTGPIGHLPNVEPTGLSSSVSTSKRNGNGPICYLRSRAMEEIHSHIQWGEHTSENCVEQGGVLLGTPYLTANGNCACIVERAIVGELGRGTSAYLELDHAAWKVMLEKAEQLQEVDASLQVVGWYHTHPNGLDVFMSGTDRATQRHFFAHPWQFAVVLNPHRKIWGSFAGADATVCEGLVIR